MQKEAAGVGGEKAEEEKAAVEGKAAPDIAAARRSAPPGRLPPPLPPPPLVREEVGEVRSAAAAEEGVGRDGSARQAVTSCGGGWAEAGRPSAPCHPLHTRTVPSALQLHSSGSLASSAFNRYSAATGGCGLCPRPPGPPVPRRRATLPAPALPPAAPSSSSEPLGRVQTRTTPCASP